MFIRWTCAYNLTINPNCLYVLTIKAKTRENIKITLMTIAKYETPDCKYKGNPTIKVGAAIGAATTHTRVINHPTRLGKLIKRYVSKSYSLALTLKAGRNAIIAFFE